MVAENPDVMGYVTVTQMDDTIRAGTAVGRDSIVFWSIQNELASYAIGSQNRQSRKEMF
jgi:hypothetical protein